MPLSFSTPRGSLFPLHLKSQEQRRLRGRKQTVNDRVEIIVLQCIRPTVLPLDHDPSSHRLSNTTTTAPKTSTHPTISILKSKLQYFNLFCKVSVPNEGHSSNCSRVTAKIARFNSVNYEIIYIRCNRINTI